MKPFAKLYDTLAGQLLVMDTTDDAGAPLVSVSFRPEGLGVCSLNLGHPDTDAGWEAHDVLFDALDKEHTTKMVLESLKSMGLEPPQEPTCS